MKVCLFSGVVLVAALGTCRGLGEVPGVVDGLSPAGYVGRIGGIHGYLDGGSYGAVAEHLAGILDDNGLVFRCWNSSYMYCRSTF